MLHATTYGILYRFLILVGCQRDDSAMLLVRALVFPLELQYCLGGLVAIHHRHVKVHDYQFVILILAVSVRASWSSPVFDEFLNRFLPVDSFVNYEPLLELKEKVFIELGLIEFAFFLLKMKFVFFLTDLIFYV